ncbi:MULTISPECIES: VOC family protein [unclassified Streptomyces]|uniref:VOC family protein n=1 Tax=unclassified Streptomyces TaxID=2593676 RepID=UPI002E13520D|nr:VOC family protein [Streptomyces sp. NBC_01207]WTA17158.1 VOC family protein [Streptomyces sp. NBC_00853]
MSLTPRLIVPDPDIATTYYQKAMGAEEVFRAQDDSGRVMVVVLQIGGSPLSLSPAVPEWGWLSPDDIGGSPVLLEAEFTDQDAVAERMVASGGTVVVPVENRPYGKREGRLRDPFGHLWIVTGELR